MLLQSLLKLNIVHQFLKSFVDCNVTPWWQGYENLARVYSGGGGRMLMLAEKNTKGER